LVGDVPEFLEHLLVGFGGGRCGRSMTDPSHTVLFLKRVNGRP
jgi:hypothetical protein